MRARVALVTFAVLLFTLVPSRAVAHTELVSTDPQDGSRLDVAPTTVTLSFNEAISPELSTVVVSVGAEGDERRSVLDVRQGGTPSTLTAAVPRHDLPDGGVDTAWVATYRVTSRDGHAVEGSFAFRAPADGGPQSADPSTSPAPLEPAAPSPSPGTSDTPQVESQGVDGSTASTSTSTSTLVIGGIALAGAALGCGLLVRARRRSLDA